MQVVTGPVYNVWDLRMNVASKPFDDLRVRQAVAGYGLDRQEILKLGFLGYGQPSVSMLTPGMPGYNSLMERYPYDRKKATTLLQEAGYGPGHPFTFTFLAPTIEPAFTNVPTLLKAQLARLGVQMKIDMLDKVTWMDRFVRQHDFEMTMGNVTAVALGNLALILETTAPSTSPATAIRGWMRCSSSGARRRMRRHTPRPPSSCKATWPTSST